jgi:hypothetical protein
MTTRLVDTAPVEQRLEAERLHAGPSGTSPLTNTAETSLFEEEEKKPIPKVAFVVGLSAVSSVPVSAHQPIDCIHRWFNTHTASKHQKIIQSTTQVLIPQ